MKNTQAVLDLLLITVISPSGTDFMEKGGC